VSKYVFIQQQDQVLMHGQPETFIQTVFDEKTERVEYRILQSTEACNTYQTGLAICSHLIKLGLPQWRGGVAQSSKCHLRKVELKICCQIPAGLSAAAPIGLPIHWVDRRVRTSKTLCCNIFHGKQKVFKRKHFLIKLQTIATHPLQSLTLAKHVVCTRGAAF